MIFYFSVLHSVVTQLMNPVLFVLRSVKPLEGVIVFVSPKRYCVHTMEMFNSRKKKKSLFLVFFLSLSFPDLYVCVSVFVRSINFDKFRMYSIISEVCLFLRV
jgi:hypothetical protein